MKLQPIITQIKENAKQGLDIENALYMLMVNTIIYSSSDIEIKYFTSPNRTYRMKCIKFLEEIKKISQNVDVLQLYHQLNIDKYDDEGFEDSDTEKQNLYNKEALILQKGRKPNIQEDSLIQSLLGHLNEKEELLKKRCNFRKINPESFREFLDITNPYELWKIIQDIKGGYYFFEVFENQKEEYGINYQCIDKMMMCSKAYEREYQQFKTNLRQQQDLHISTLKQELNKMSQINISSTSEPICLVIKEDPDLQCNCDDRGARQLIRQWSFMNQLQKCFLKSNEQKNEQFDFKEYFKTVVLNLDQWAQQFNQQFDQLIKINEILKSKLMSLRVLNQQLQQEQLNLTKTYKLQDEEVFKLKQLICKLQLEKSLITTKLITTESSLIKIKEFCDSNSVVNRKKLVNENLEQLELQNNQTERLLKQQYISQLTQTENSFEYQLCTICKGENALFQNIQQLKIPTISFEKVDLQQIEDGPHLQNKLTQTEFKQWHLAHKNSIYQQQDESSHSPMITRKRGKTTYQGNDDNSILKKNLTRSPPKSNVIVRPVFKRLFDDCEKKKLRQSQRSSRIQDDERNQWEEMLSLLNLLKTERNNQNFQKKVQKSIEFYKDQFETKEKLPQLKLKERQKVPEHLIDTILKELQENKKVALTDLVEQFQTILTINRLNKSREGCNKLTI